MAHMKCKMRKMIITKTITSFEIYCLKSLKPKLSSVSASVERDPAVRKTLIKKQELKLHQEPFRKDSGRERFCGDCFPLSPFSVKALPRTLQARMLRARSPLCWALPSAPQRLPTRARSSPCGYRGSSLGTGGCVCA